MKTLIGFKRSVLAAALATAAATLATAAPRGKSVPGPEFPAALAAQ